MDGTRFKKAIPYRRIVTSEKTWDFVYTNGSIIYQLSSQMSFNFT